MLCPEVWNFDPPSFSFSDKICNSEDEILRKINHQYFNHYVSVTLPNTIQLPTDIINAFLEDSQYYRIDKVPAAELVKKDFINFFVKSGELTAISLAEFSEQNSFVITPCGKFILSLSKSTFQELGVEDTFTKHSKSSLRKYFVVLDLTSESCESKKKFEQVQKKLAACSNLHFDIVLCWEPEDSNVCPSSIAYYFSKKGYDVKACDILYKHELKYNTVVPLFEDKADADDFIEWLGAFSLDCDISDGNLFSSLRCPEKNEIFGQVMHLSFSGLVSHNRLKRVITEINKYIEAKHPLMWISLTVQGFQDSILSVKNKNLFLSEGDQLCVVVFRWNHPSLVYCFQEKKS